MIALVVYSIFDLAVVVQDALDPARYDQDMERLLTNLALKTKAIRDLQAKKDKP